VEGAGKGEVEEEGKGTVAGNARRVADAGGGRSESGSVEEAAAEGRGRKGILLAHGKDWNCTAVASTGTKAQRQDDTA
jgi:hypothetical protein